MPFVHHHALMRTIPSRGFRLSGFSPSGSSGRVAAEAATPKTKGRSTESSRSRPFLISQSKKEANSDANSASDPGNFLGFFFRIESEN
ncbi:hypothetical protein FF2_045269 [Malus domestica]